MEERKLEVEKQLLEILNLLLKNAKVSLSIGDLKPGNIFPIYAKGDGLAEKNIGYIWPEWHGVYVVCVGRHRGVYLDWRDDENGVTMAITTETFLPNQFLNPEKSLVSKEFKALSKAFLEEYLCC